MDFHTIANMLRDLGADKVRVVRGGSKVACCCMLARWTHTKGRDTSPSMVVMEGKHGDPIYKCQSCHETGTLVDLLLFLRTRGRHEVVPWIHALEGQRAVESLSSEERRARREARLSVFGAEPPVPVKAAEPVQPVVNPDGGKPFYDYMAVAKADEIEPVPEEEYDPYKGHVPRYALQRGLSIETCRAFELGNDPDMKRMLFPIRDRAGRLVAISGRLYARACLRCGGEWVVRCRRCNSLEFTHRKGELGDCLVCADGEMFEPQRPECVKCELPQPPKYLHSTGFRRNLILYGEHMKDRAEDGRGYVVEGHIDMLRMWQAMYRPTFALLGSYPGPTQIEKLVKYCRSLIVVGDGNRAGKEMNQRVKQMVAGRIPVFVRDLDDEMDPGKMTDEQLRDKVGAPPKLELAA